MPALLHTVEEYFYQEYPKWKFRLKDGQPEGQIVQNKEEENALEGDWADTLTALGIETCPPARMAAPLTSLLSGFVMTAPPAPPAEEEAGPNGGRSRA
jgi:hypothetical protein